MMHTKQKSVRHSVPKYKDILYSILMYKRNYISDQSGMFDSPLNVFESGYIKVDSPDHDLDLLGQIYS